MPVMNGMEATKKIRQYLKDEYRLRREEQPAIIGVTGHVLEEYQREGLLCGMDEIVAKPVYF